MAGDSNFDACKIKRKGLRISLTKQADKLKNLITVNGSLVSIKSVLLTCQSIYNSLKILDEQILDHISQNNDLNSIDAEITDSLKYTELINECKCSVDEFECSQGSPSLTTNDRVNHPKCVKLPNLQLPEFSGGFSEFLSFFDQFKSAVGNNPQLTNVQKLTYLKGCVKGEAALLISHLPLTNDSYEYAIETLENTYSRSVLNKLTLLGKFNNLSLDNCKVDSLMKYRANFENLLGCLNQSGIKVKGSEAAEAIVVSILLNKLPEQLRLNIHRSAADDLLKLDKFKESFQIELDLLASKSSLSNKISSKIPKPERSLVVESSFDESTAASLVVSQKQKLKPKIRANNNFKCHLCNGTEHVTKLCNVYSTCKARKARIIEIPDRCNDCGTKHVGQCPVLKCTSCQGNHWAVLCPNIDQGQKVVSASLGANNSNMPLVAIPKLMINVQNFNDVSSSMMGVSTVLDSASQRSLVKSSLANELKLKRVGKTGNLDLVGVNCKVTSKNFDIVEIPFVKYGKIFRIKAIVIDKLPEVYVPNLSQLSHKAGQSHNVKMASTIDDTDISLLIGMDHYYDVVNPNSRALRYRNGWLIPTCYGYVLSGKLGYCKTNSICQSVTILRINLCNDNIIICDDSSDSISNVAQLWELDNIGIKDESGISVHEDILNNFKSKIEFIDGHYQVSLPWKDKENKLLPTNFSLAKGRLNSLLKKIKSNEDLIGNYNKVLNDQIVRGFIEEVPLDEKFNENSHYLPHRAIIRQHATTPIRIVYDCSARATKFDKSLNDCLYTGPDLVPELARIILRFRYSKYVCISDISKAFLQIHLNPKDRDYTRFLWIKDANKSIYDLNNLKFYRFRVVLFGATSSPFLLQATIQHHMENYGKSCNKDVNYLWRNLYVDNLHGCTETSQELISFYEEALRCYSTAGLPLAEWSSNCGELNEIIKSDNLNPKDDTDKVKVLGLVWDKHFDTLTVKLQEIECGTKLTKRKVISDVSRIFDPLGFLGPVVIQSRIFIQKLWKNKFKWDTQLPDSLNVEWGSILILINQSLPLVVPRRVIFNYKVKLNVFSDASLEAYGCVAYVTDNDRSELLMSKCKVAPLKELTVPKLELMALLLSVRMTKYIIDSYVREVEFVNINFWCDSSCVLAWVQDNSRVENVFVSNRLKEISNITKTFKCINFFYVNSSDNPADLLTRYNLSVNLVNNEIWLKGPVWLSNNEYWPNNHNNFCLKSDQALILSNVVKNNTLTVKTCEGLPDLSRFSSFMKLLKVTSYVLRFINNCRNKVRSESTLIRFNEIRLAENTWIKYVQLQYFDREFNALKNKTRSPLVGQLNLFIDNDIIKVRTRLENSTLRDSVKNPILLPRDSHFTELLVEYLHKVELHSPVNNLIITIRQRFWIVKCRQFVGKIVNRCIICRRQRAIKYSIPDTPALPELRVSADRAFQITGVDYTGAIFIKEGNIKSKAYICLFTCAVTRAVHLDLALDNSAQAFSFVITRFIARRGKPQIMLSDNGSNFRSFSSILENFYADSDVNDQLNSFKIEWKFIPSRAPWFGGFWERMIGVTKSILRKVIGRSLLSREHLYTILTEVESKINDRPLGYVAESELDVISPSQLLIGHRLNDFPYPVKEDCHETLTNSKVNKQFKKINNLINAAWLSWQKQYLMFLKDQGLVSRPNNSGKIEPMVNDLVILVDDKPKNLWNLGRIVEVIQSKDCKDRVVKLKTKGGLVFRPISKVAFMESAEYVDKLFDQDSISSFDNNKRPKRAQAQASLDKIKDLSKKRLI